VVAGLLAHMKIKAFHTVLIVALLAVLITATYQLNRPERGQDPQSEPVQNMSWQPPAWVLPSASGQTFRYPQDLSGPTVILFWATWCPYCKALMPHLQSILDEYRGRHGITVLAIVFRDDGDPLSVLHDRGYEFDLFTEGDAVAESWGVKGAPGLFLADSHQGGTIPTASRA
jgi:thiol-disulfide isomerase/thioredoxin